MIISLVVCLGIAAVCFGGFAYNVLVKRHAADPGEYLAEISTILVFTGLFFYGHGVWIYCARHGRKG